MPTDRDRAARRRASALLATEYGWPSRRPSRARWIATLLVLDIAALVAGVLGWALIFGWRP